MPILVDSPTASHPLIFRKENVFWILSCKRSPYISDCFSYELVAHLTLNLFLNVSFDCCHLSKHAVTFSGRYLLIFFRNWHWVKCHSSDKRMSKWERLKRNFKLHCFLHPLFLLLLLSSSLAPSSDSKTAASGLGQTAWLLLRWRHRTGCGASLSRHSALRGSGWLPHTNSYRAALSTEPERHWSVWAA